MKSSYESFLKELDKTKKILAEAYMFDDEDPRQHPMPNYEEEEIPEDSEDEFNEGGRDVDDGEDISKYDERIAKIREVAIQGLQDYAENINDARYQFFKKVFLECDKACQEKDGAAVK